MMRLIAFFPLLVLSGCGFHAKSPAAEVQATCFDLSPLPPPNLPHPPAATHALCPREGRAARVPVFGKDGCQFPADQGGWAGADQRVGFDPAYRSYRREFLGKAWHWVYFYDAPAGWAYVPEDALVKNEEGGCDARYGNGGENGAGSGAGTPPGPAQPGRLELSEGDKTPLVANDGVFDFYVTRAWLPDGSHKGVDLALRRGDVTGQPVFAIGSPGADVYVWCWADDFVGTQATTWSPGMDFVFSYGHLSQCVFPERTFGVVRAGERIGAMGNTGRWTTGPHLHFEQRKITSGLDVGTITGTRGLLSAMSASNEVKVWRKFAEMAVRGSR